MKLLGVEMEKPLKQKNAENEPASLKKVIEQQRAEIFQLRSIIDNLPGDVYWKNKEGVWLGLNLRSSEDLRKAGFLWKTDEVVGKTDYELYNKETADEFRKNDLKIMQQGTESSSEEVNILPSGERIVQLSTKRPLWDENGMVAGIVGISSDITYLKEIEKQLILAKEKAELASRAKTEFITNMSHDIRTPLTGVIGSAYILEKNAKTKDDYDTARMISVSGQRLLDLLNGVLDVLSADNLNDDDLNNETFDLPSCMHGLCDLMRPVVTTKGIDLLLKIDPTVSRYVMNDRLKIERILLNLMGNAVKFTEKGHVELHVKSLKLDDRQGYDYLEFAVTDTGIGIPKEKIGQVFDRFFRIKPSYAGSHRGHGVGLYIVKKYVALLGGEVHVQSEINKGTTFYFSLMMKQGNAEDVEEITESELDEQTILNFTEIKTPEYVAKAELVDAKGAFSVLYVEDDVIASQVGVRMLQAVGCAVYPASSAETALQLFKDQRFDLVVSDVGLPGMSGAELAALLRHWERVNNKTPTPVIALTSHAAGAATQECLLAGMNKVFAKPLSEETAKQILEEFCHCSIQANLEHSADKYSHAQTSSPEKTVNPPSKGLGVDLPATEAELFQLEQYPLLDCEQGIDIVGSETALREIIGMLVDELLPGREVDNLQKAYESGDWNKVASISHKLKGSALYSGTIKMRYACQYLERYHKAGYSKHTDKLYQQCLAVLHQTREHIIDWLKH